MKAAEVEVPERLRDAHRSRSACAISLAALALGSCSTDEVKDPSYLLVQLTPVPGASVEPGAARVEIESGTTVIASACIHLGESGASFVLKRDASKAQDARVTVEVSAYESLSGQTNVGPGDEFTCPTTLPPAIAPPQSVSVSFCPAQAKRLVFYVGATCGCSGVGGAGGEGGQGSSSSSTSSSSVSSSASTGGAGGMGGGAGGTSEVGGGSATVGAGGAGASGGGGKGGAGGAGGSASSSSSSSSTSSSSSGAGAGGGGGPSGCGCGPTQTCGAGLSTEGRTCGPNECCNVNVSTPCALEPANRPLAGSLSFGR